MTVSSRGIRVGAYTPVVSTTVFTPVGAHISVTDLSAAIVISPGALGIGSVADRVIIQAISQNVRWTLDGTTPTATIGFQLRTTDDPKEIPITKGVTLTVIEEAGGAVLQVQFGNG